MISIRLTDGLGNQLFQYAAARALALRKGVEVGLDLRFYQAPLQPGRPPRAFELGAFSIRVAPVQNEILPRFPLGREAPYVFPRPTPFSAFNEDRRAFDSRVLSLPDWTWLNGFFQCEQYFADFADAIRSEFTVVKTASPENAEMADRIRDCEAVSVHVRRGDYVSGKRSAFLFGPVRRGYYVRAIAHMVRHVRKPVFFVFSDEPDWVESNLQLDVPIVIVRQKGSACEDIRLMTLCKHNIIANSTFSWWGAWLNPSPKKIVTAPTPWFRNRPDHASTIVPRGWVRL